MDPPTFIASGICNGFRSYLKQLLKIHKCLKKKREQRSVFLISCLLPVVYLSLFMCTRVRCTLYFFALSGPATPSLSCQSETWTSPPPTFRGMHLRGRVSIMRRMLPWNSYQLTVSRALREGKSSEIWSKMRSRYSLGRDENEALESVFVEGRVVPASTCGPWLVGWTVQYLDRRIELLIVDCGLFRRCRKVISRRWQRL